jgi:hypothetical protein
MKSFRSGRRLFLVTLTVAAVLLGGMASGLSGLCGPFTDVAADSFCPFVLEIFYLGITTGTTPTTYDPSSSVNRLQMAAFLSRSVDGVLKRGGRRGALQQWWTSQNSGVLGTTTLGEGTLLAQSDGTDIWACGQGQVFRVRGSDGKLLETWTGAFGGFAPLVAMGRILIAASTGNASPGKLYSIDPTKPAGDVTTVATNLGLSPSGIAFDGARIWTGNAASLVTGGSVSIITPGTFAVTTVTTGFAAPGGAMYDGTNIWVADYGAGTLLKLDGTGAILQTVTIGANPTFPIFDGANIWVPNSASSSVSVVRASSGAVLATLTGNGLNTPAAVAFDGQRMLVANVFSNSVSLWKAADLTTLGNFGTGLNSNPYGACSDGVNFWVVLSYAGQAVPSRLARF